MKPTVGQNVSKDGKVLRQKEVKLPRSGKILT
jgi:hypothetical protein